MTFMEIEFDEYDIKELIAEKYDVSTDEITFNVTKTFNSCGDEEYSISAEVLH